MNWRMPILQCLLDLKALALRGRTNMNRCFDETLRLEFAERPVLDEYVQRHLEALLLHSCRHTTYYRRILSQVGVVADGRLHIDRFRHIPPLTKDVLRERQDELISDDRASRHPYRNTSGGSTGEPVEFVQDSAYKDWNRATALFYNHMLGKEMGEREAKLWGSERDILEGSIGLRAKVENFLYNRLLLNSFMMTPQMMRGYVEKLNRFRPVSLWAYVDSAWELARFIEREGLESQPVPVTIVTIGTLTEAARETIERALRTKVYNQYGSREVGPIACECPEQEGLHIFEWATYVEVIDASGRPLPPGQEGEVCVTLLTNYSMPLIRYRIGDVAVLSDRTCACGRSMRLLGAVTGRVMDHFVRADGTIIHGQYFIQILYHRPWVLRFQVVQESCDHVVVNLVVSEEPGTEEKEEIRRMIRAVMGDGCRVEFRFLDRIEPSRSGKYLYVLSNVAR